MSKFLNLETLWVTRVSARILKHSAGLVFGCHYIQDIGLFGTCYLQFFIVLIVTYSFISLVSNCFLVTIDSVKAPFLSYGIDFTHD